MSGAPDAIGAGSGLISMAARRPLALSYVVALLIASADASLLIGASPSDEGGDCRFGECYGADMLPEKLDPFVPEPRTDEKIPNNVVSECGNGDEDVELRNQDQVQEDIRLLAARQKSQIEHFDALAERLQQLLDKLETAFLRSPQPAGPEHQIASHVAPIGMARGSDGVGAGPSEDHAFAEINAPKIEEIKALESVPSGDGAVDGGRQGHARQPAGGLTVAKYKPAWSEHFQFLSAVKVDGEVTCLHTLPQEGEDGLSKFVAAGVDKGRLYIFSSHGDLLLDFQTASNLPITAIVSYSVRRNETVILTGHSDGSVLMHKLWEARRTGSLIGDDWFTLSMENVQSLLIPSTQGSLIDFSTAGREPVKQSQLQGPISILEAYRVGRLRYILASDSGGNIALFRDDGTFYGIAKASSKPLAFLRQPNSQRLLFLTHEGVSSLDLRSLAVKNGPCEGLDGSKAVAYTFDATGRSKAYGFSDEGHMIYVALSGDTLHFECHVRLKRKLDMGNYLALQGIKGYLLVVTPAQVLVYNTTLQAGHSFNTISVGVPRLLFASSLDEITMPFLNEPIQRQRLPVIACNRERLVVLGFGDGFVGMYKSYLPVQRSRNFSSRTWSSPVIIIVLMFLGGWYFFGKKRDAPISMSDFDMALTPSATDTPGYRRAAMDAPIDARADSRRYASRGGDAFPGSATGGYSATALKYRSPITEQRYRTGEDTSFISSTSEDTSMRDSLEPFFQREPAESKFRVAKLESSFQNPLADSGPYPTRELDLKAARASASLHPRIKRLQEPNSF